MNFLFKRPAWELAIYSGIMVGVAYLPLHLGFFVYIGFIPLFHSWLNENSKTNLQSGYLFGLIYNIISNYWIGANSGAEFSVVIFSLISAVLYLSIFWGIAGIIIGKLREKNNCYIILPFLIVSLEWLRSFGPLGFPWGNLALTQTEYLPILQFIDYTGTYLITFLVILINVTLYNIICIGYLTVIHRTIFLSILFIFVIGGWLKIINYSSLADKIDIAIIQPNIDPNKKWDYSSRESTLRFMDSLYTTAISLEPDIILFPETALPTYLRLNNNVRKKLQSKVDLTGIPILIGTVDRLIGFNGEKTYYNSTMYLVPNKQYLMYDKIHLVPFAEYDLIPDMFFPLDKLNLNIDRGIFKGGNNYILFKFNNIMFSNLICYESSFPRYSREFVKNGAEFLMIQANDGWLGNSAGPYQHFEHARLRAIENRVPVVRSGNTGISGVILPTGEIQRKVPLGNELVFIETISLTNAGSFYSKHGDVFAALCFVIFLFIGPKNILKI